MAKKPRLTLAQLRDAPYNPRTITAEALEGLKASMGRFGDLSGFVYNVRTRYWAVAGARSGLGR